MPLRKTQSQRLRCLTEKEWVRLHNELPDRLRPMAEFVITTWLLEKYYDAPVRENRPRPRCFVPP